LEKELGFFHPLFVLFFFFLLAIVLSIERLDIVLSDFCPDIYPWADIAVALPVFTYGKN
jgi:hypothetical protein